MIDTRWRYSLRFLTLCIACLCSCSSNRTKEKLCVDNLNFSTQQLKLQYELASAAKRNPRTTNVDGTMHWTNATADWTDGFFSGSLWSLYEYSHDKYFMKAAREMEHLFISNRFNTHSHDLGFMFNCSFGHDLRLTGDAEVKQVLIDASNSLMTRFRPEVGCIQSWDVNSGWQADRGWKCPVIIDNMMNLEMLFKASVLTGDSAYQKVAISHALTTIKNHYRPDNSCFHVVDYDPKTGAVRSKETAQGFSDDSDWARGQAWGLYGFVVCYRYTKNPVFLEQAKKIATFIMTNPSIPSDNIPYWDYDATADFKGHPRDVSAAACTASALIELSKYAKGNYLDYAKTILTSLSTPNYQAKLGENNDFILMHSVGSIPHDNEVDVPLNYADYYYVEALIRLNQINEKN